MRGRLGAIYRLFEGRRLRLRVLGGWTLGEEG